MENLYQDLRFALRALRKSPGFAAVTIGVLALGIGANTAIFSVVHAVLLKPLPFPDAERIVVVPHTPPQDIFPGRKYFSVSPANYYDWKAQNDVFSHMAMVAGGRATLTGSGEPASVSAYYVTSEFFPVMGARPLMGRVFTASDDEPGQDVAIISEEMWKSRFGASPSVVGSTMIVDGKSHAIVGVLPEKLAYPPETRALDSARSLAGGQGAAGDPRLRRPRPPEGRRLAGRGAGPDERHRGSPGRAVPGGQQGMGRRCPGLPRGPRRATCGRRCSSCSAPWASCS